MKKRTQVPLQKMRTLNENYPKGLTLTELLAGMIILGVLASVVITNGVNFISPGQ